MIMKTKLFFIFFAIIFSIPVLQIRGSDKDSDKDKSEITYRGIVLYPSDIISIGPSRLIQFMNKSHLNLLGIHCDTRFETLPVLKIFLESQEGQYLINECKKNNISLEFELHALKELLPRELFAEHPEYFRQDKNGNRKNDYNMCFSSEGAYRVIEQNIAEITKWLKPSTHRYFFWTDDVGGYFCNCDKCRQFSASEQALLYENMILSFLKKIDPLATLAHLAYGDAYEAPLKVKPSVGIFLEYAPIGRDYSEPLSDLHIQRLNNNLQVFPGNTAHILEYWLDASMHSKWDRKNLVKIPWNIHDCSRDVELYTAVGIKSVTTFATWMISIDYVNKFGMKKTLNDLKEYGSVLRKYIK